MQGTQIILLIYRLVDHAHKTILNILRLQPFYIWPKLWHHHFTWDNTLGIKTMDSAKTKYLYDSQNITLEAIMKHPFKYFHEYMKSCTSKQIFTMHNTAYACIIMRLNCTLLTILYYIFPQQKLANVTGFNAFLEL